MIWPNDRSPVCLSCQAEAIWKATGEFPSRQARNHWSMWGCTCDPADAKAAADFIRSVSD